MLMTRTVLLGEPPPVVTEWLRHRRELGQDGFDEVWDGEYHVAPMVHRRQGDVDAQLAVLLWPRARHLGLWPSSPANIGEPQNYRVPDRIYFRDRALELFNPTAAIAVEIVSPGDESYAKFGFYFARGVEEMLIVDPLRRSVEWYGRGAEGFERTGRSELLELTETALAAEIDWPPTD
jgi:Uma2 family endonuclease